MADHTDLKAEIVELTNAYYAKKNIRKTVSEGSWEKITEPCSSEQISEAATDICAEYGVKVPSDAKGLIAKGLDAVASYVADRSNSLPPGLDPAKSKSLPE